MQWPRKLYEQEVIPPPHCWEEIREKISGEPLKLGHTLHDMAIHPPPAAWEHIQKEIQTSPRISGPAPVKTLSRRPVLSYAAAVAGLMVLASVLWYVFNQNQETVKVTDLAAGLGYTDSPAKNTNPPVTDAARAILPSPTPGDKIAPVNSTPLTATEPRPSTDVDNGTPRIAIRTTQVSYADGNYIQLMEPDGDVTRVSYKLKGMIRTVQESKGSRIRWDKQVDEWKKKMARSSYVPSGNNFFDLAEMIQCMETGQ